MGKQAQPKTCDAHACARSRSCGGGFHQPSSWIATAGYWRVQFSARPGSFVQSGGKGGGGSSPPRGTGSFRSASMSSAPMSGRLLSRDGKPCSPSFPIRGVRWPRITATRMNAAACPKSAAGNWSEPGLLARREMAHVVPIHVSGNFARVSSGWGKMADPFDPAFAAAADGDVIKAASAYRDDPYLIGYFVDNELAWGLGNAADPQLRYGLAVETLRLGPASLAKRAFVAQLTDKYRDAKNLAAAWGVSVHSWDELREANPTLSSTSLAKAAIIDDLRAFTTLFAETYFRVVGETIRRHDPHHLYLGSRFQACTPEAVAECARYCDVVSFNVYREELSGEEWREFHALGKPAMIGEFQFGSTDTGLFWPGLFDVAAEDQRGPAYGTYLRWALANPDIVGCHWFQYVDEPLTGRLLDGENGNMGFVAVTDRPYGSLVSAAREANLALLKWLQW